MGHVLLPGPCFHLPMMLPNFALFGFWPPNHLFGPQLDA